MCATGSAVCAHMQAAECMACAPWARRRSPAAAASTRGATRRIARCRTYRLATKGRPSCVLPTRCVLEAASPCKAARNCTLHACTSHFVAPKFCYIAYGPICRPPDRSLGKNVNSLNEQEENGGLRTRPQRAGSAYLHRKLV